MPWRDCAGELPLGRRSGQNRAYRYSIHLRFPVDIIRLSYYAMRVIRTIKDRETQKLWDRTFSRKFQSIEKVARIRLAFLHRAESLRDLKLPGLRLEALKADRKRQFSIRINTK